MNQLDLFAAYKPTAGARTTDPETSRQAAVAQIGRKADNHRRVLLALYEAGYDGLTDHELAAVLGSPQTSCGVRRGEVRNQGLVRMARDERGVVRTRLSPMGSPCIVWVLTLDGLIAAETQT